MATSGTTSRSMPIVKFSVAEVCELSGSSGSYTFMWTMSLYPLGFSLNEASYPIAWSDPCG